MSADVNNKRRFSLGVAGSDSTPIDVVDLGWKNFLKDPFPSDDSILSAGSTATYVQPENWAEAQAIPAYAAALDDVPADWSSAGARLVVTAGDEDAWICVCAIDDASLEAAAYDSNGLMQKHGSIYRIPAHGTFAETFATPRKHWLYVKLLDGELAAPADGIRAIEVMWKRGI